MDALFFYWSATWDYLVQMVPSALAAALFLCLRPARRKRLAGSGRISSARREGALFLFTLFCAGLAALTLFPAGFWSDLLRGQIVWPKPSVGRFFWRFTILRDLSRGGWLRYMLLGNVAMFVPLGFFPALLWDRPRWWKSLLIGFFASLFIEVAQLFVSRGSDVNDILLNTLGALCGFWAYLFCRRIAPALTHSFQLQKTEVSHERSNGN